MGEGEVSVEELSGLSRSSSEEDSQEDSQEDSLNHIDLSKEENADGTLDCELREAGGGDQWSCVGEVDPVEVGVAADGNNQMSAESEYVTADESPQSYGSGSDTNQPQRRTKRSRVGRRVLTYDSNFRQTSTKQTATTKPRPKCFDLGRLKQNDK